MYGEWASDLAELGYYDHLTDIERLASAYYTSPLLLELCKNGKQSFTWKGILLNWDHSPDIYCQIVELAELNKYFWANSEAIVNKIISCVPRRQAVQALKFLLSEFSNKIVPLLQKSQLVKKIVDSKMTLEIIDLLYSYVTI